MEIPLKLCLPRSQQDVICPVGSLEKRHYRVEKGRGEPETPPKLKMKGEMMKHSSWFRVGVLVLFFLATATTSFAGNDGPKPGRPDIPQVWTEIDPAQVYPDFEYNGLTPACSACPTCTSDKFTFFAKGGTSNNLLVYFQGGGGCWDSVNCLYAPTYNQQQGETVEAFADTEGMGIFDTSNPHNPFKKWNIVYIPYCTGDIHWGANDMEYPDIWGQIPGLDSWTIQHRGFVNFQVVLKWIEENFERPKEIFVTGISAGSYGAILGFPYIKGVFPNSRSYVLGDAGNGITADDFRTGAIFNWNPQYPVWIPGFEDPSTLSPTDLYQLIAAEYPSSKLAQYTTAWDGTQAWFYNIQLDDDYGVPLLYQPWLWDSLPSDDVWCDWNDQMLDFAHETAEASSNYRYYVAAGIDHTIMMSPKFYTEDSAGIPFEKWVRAMVSDGEMKGGGRWENLACEDCGDPIVCAP